MDKSRISFSGKKLLLMLSVFLVLSCEKWTPLADGYFVVDGRRYNVHILYIQVATFPDPSANWISAILQGAPYYNVDMSVVSKENKLTTGTYDVTLIHETGQMNMSIEYGNNSYLSTGNNSDGIMTVKASDDYYVLDFDGTVQGHEVQFHYSGLANID